MYVWYSYSVVTFTSQATTSHTATTSRAPMTSRTALEETMAVRSAEGVTEWRTWGPGGGMMLPLGHFPRRTPFSLIAWRFEEWEKYAHDYGIDIKPMQDPLYYYIKWKAIWKLQHASPTCTHEGCGRVACIHGVMVQHFPQREELCASCAVNLAKRGLLSADLIPPVGTPRRFWDTAIRARGSIFPAG